MSKLYIPSLPPELPAKGTAFSRWCGRCALRLFGWRIEGEFPRQPKAVLALGPHTSNWDFIVAAAGILATGLGVSYLMKKEAFVWPFSKFFRWIGGVAIDRSAADNIVDQIAQEFEQREKFWVAITPEGTRKKVERYKTGFLRVAQKAEVPVLLIAWDFKDKKMVIDQLWPLSGSVDDDAEAIRQYLRNNYQGKFPQYQ